LRLIGSQKQSPTTLKPFERVNGMAEKSGREQPARGPGRRFTKGQSGNPNGKPRGARNKVTRAAEQLLDGEAEALTRKAIELALAGDTTALRLCMERVAPIRKGRPVHLDLPPVITASDTLAALSAVADSMAAGDITPEEAVTIASLLEAKRKAIETVEIEARLAALEQAQRPK
jgi:hypothetical protein